MVRIRKKINRTPWIQTSMLDWELDAGYLCDIREDCAEMFEVPLKKVCFVTIGATAQFNELIRSTLSEDVLQALADNGFTQMIVQYGQSEFLFQGALPADTKGIKVDGFDFDFQQGFKRYMRATQEVAMVSKEGLVICHAGAGTVLDAMRLGLNIIVVPNDSLLDNHQHELADVLVEQKYVSKASPSTLAATIRAACQMKKKQWVGPQASLARHVDEMFGYESDDREDDARQRLD